MKRRLFVHIVGLMLLGSASSVFADSSNRNQVRANLESGGWHVVWGHNFTEGDWVEGASALASSISCECPTPFLKWFDYKVNQMIDKLRSNLPGVGESVIRNWITQSLNDKRIVTYKGAAIQAGFVTYDRWQEACIDVPGYGKLCAGCVNVFGRRYCARKINLPNWHQFYIRFKLKTGGGQQSGGDDSITWGKVCSVARRASDSFTYYAYNPNPNISWDSVCDTARDMARRGSPGRAVTHFWKTTYNVNGRNAAIAECVNGTYRVTANGYSAISAVNKKRKEYNGKGCLFKVQK